MAAMENYNLKKGIFFILISSASFALMNFFVRMAGDLPFIEKAFFRNFVALILALIVIVRKKPSKEELHLKGNWTGLIIRSAAGALGIFCNFYAVDHLLLADASMLNKMSPFFGVLFSYFILKEKPSLKQLLLVLGAFIGALLVIKPTFSNMNLFPSVIGLIGGMGAGLAYTMVRRLTSRGVYPPFIVFFFSFFTLLLTLPQMIFAYVPMSGYQLAMLLLAGTAAASGQFSVTAAYRYAPAKEISVYDYNQIVVSALLGFIFLSQVPDLMAVAGYIIVITMGVLMALLSRSKDAHQLKQGNQR